MRLIWILHTAFRAVFIADQRFLAIKQPDKYWTLQIKYVQARDAGSYECQVSTEPKVSARVQLQVVGKSKPRPSPRPRPWTWALNARAYEYEFALGQWKLGSGWVERIICGYQGVKVKRQHMRKLFSPLTKGRTEQSHTWAEIFACFMRQLHFKLLTKLHSNCGCWPLAIEMLEKRVLKKSKAEHTDGTFLWSVKFFNEKTFTCWALVSFWFPRHTNTHTHTPKHPSTE